MKLLAILSVFLALPFAAKADPVVGPTCTSVGVRAEFGSVPTLAQWLDVVGLPRERVDRPYGVVLSPERDECVSEMVIKLKAALADQKDLNAKQADENKLLKDKLDAEHIARLRAEAKASSPSYRISFGLGGLITGYALGKEPWRDW